MLCLPDGSAVPDWDDATDYQHDWHVAPDRPAATDDGPGDRTAPLASLAEACRRAEPGQRVVLHPGVYHEPLRPCRSGAGPTAMIAFVAAETGRAVLSGSRRWQPEPEELNRRFRFPGTWRAALPAACFAGDNPFQAVNLSRSRWFPWRQRPDAERERLLQRRGLLWQDGRRLLQVTDIDELTAGPGRYWVEDDGLALVVRLFEDADPQHCRLAVSTRQQLVVPTERGLGWIRLDGLTIHGAGNGLVPPQRGAVSCAAGHHWLIERCHIEEVNGLGLDIGGGNDVHRPTPPETGAHLIRHNRIRSCGLGGIAGCGQVTGTRLLDNHLSDIGWLDLEHLYEAAAIKLHFARDVLIAGNRIEHLRDCCGIWLDYHCGNNRVSRNRLDDIATLLAAIYIEASPGPHLIDGNIISRLRDVADNDPPKDGLAGGLGISIDVSDQVAIQHNLLIAIAGPAAIACHLAQGGRRVAQRSAACAGMDLAGNLICASRTAILLDRQAHNRSRANLIAPVSGGPIRLREADREARLDLAAWRRWHGIDTDSRLLPLLCEDADGRRLGPSPHEDSDDEPPPTAPTPAPPADDWRLRLIDRRDWPHRHGFSAQPADCILEPDDSLPSLVDTGYAAPGPLTAAQWRRLRAGEPVILALIGDRLVDDLPASSADF